MPLQPKSNLPWRPRVGRPKVRTGCETCKYKIPFFILHSLHQSKQNPNSELLDRIRRIKCDEAKPACLKCTSTGRSCDGYAVANADSLHLTRANPSACRLPPSTIPNELSLVKLRTSPERRGFHFFCHHVWPQVTMALRSEFWDSLIFQASHVDAALRDATTALGAFGERLHIHSVTTSENEAANKLQDFANSQYCKAIGELRSQMCAGKQQSVELTLMTCFIFILIEFLRGNEAAASNHMISGGEIILQSYNFNISDHFPFSSRSGTSFAPSLPAGFSHHAVYLYATIERICASWLGDSPTGVVTTQTESLDFGPLICNGFTSVKQAGQYLAALLVTLQSNIILTHDGPKPPHESFKDAVPLHSKFFANLDDWALAMDVYQIRSQGEISIQDSQKATILQLQHMCATLSLTASCVSSEEDFYASLDGSFNYIVSLATSLLRPVNVMLDTSLFPTSRQFFMFKEGTIQPLYFTAIKCHNGKIQRKALSLLEAEPWREGAWDSVAMARIAKRKINQKANRDPESSGDIAAA